MKASRTIGNGTTSALTRLMTLLVFVFLLTTAAFAWLIYFAAHAHYLQAEVERHERETRPPAMSWRPDVSMCPEDVGLWNCIRHAMYREEI